MINLGSSWKVISVWSTLDLLLKKFIFPHMNVFYIYFVFGKLFLRFERFTEQPCLAPFVRGGAPLVSLGFWKLSNRTPGGKASESRAWVAGEGRGLLLGIVHPGCWGGPLWNFFLSGIFFYHLHWKNCSVNYMIVPLGSLMIMSRYRLDSWCFTVSFRRK